MTTTYTACVAVTPQQIADQMIAALEYGSNYWMTSAVVTHGQDRTSDPNVYADPALYAGDFAIKIKLAESHRRKINYMLTRKNVETGLNTMAAKQPHHFGQLIADDGDAETADVFLQCCLFGEVVYG